LLNRCGSGVSLSALQFYPWRCAQHFLTDELADWLKEITRRFNRL
jgi:hypothetical protein